MCAHISALFHMDPDESYRVITNSSQLRSMLFTQQCAGWCNLHGKGDSILVHDVGDRVSYGEPQPSPTLTTGVLSCPRNIN